MAKNTYRVFSTFLFISHYLATSFQKFKSDTTLNTKECFCLFIKRKIFYSKLEGRLFVHLPLIEKKVKINTRGGRGRQTVKNFFVFRKFSEKKIV